MGGLLRPPWAAGAMFVARRVWRYPLCVTSTAILTWLGVSSSWEACAKLTAGLMALGAVWAWQHPESFTRILVGAAALSVAPRVGLRLAASRSTLVTARR